MRWALVLAAGCAGAKADLILHRGRIITLDEERPTATAVAVRDDRIVAVGEESIVSEWRGSKTRVIDLGSGTVLPGLTDAHAHLESLGRSLDALDLRGAQSAESVAEIVAAHARETVAKHEGWIIGRGWDQNLWSDKSFPTRAVLDEAAKDRPVLLTRVDGHAVWASSAALATSGIDSSTVDPPGGLILRDSAGQPTGVLIDTAIPLIERHVPEPTAETREKWIRRAIDQCLRVGLTQIHDMAVDERAYRILRRLADRGELKIRVYAIGAPKDADRLLDTAPEIGSLLTRRAIKLFVDGALGSRGAAMLESYSDDPNNRGLILTTRERLVALSRRALASGWQVAVHAIGDRGNRIALDAFEEAVGNRRDHRFRVEHVQIVHPDDFPRFQRIGVIASIQPAHFTSDRDWAPKRIGHERMKGAYALRSLQKAGAALAFGSDFPVEQPDPRLGFAAAVQRGDESLDPKDALRGFTTGAAFAAFEEGKRGVIRAGMLADFTVLAGDFMTAAPTAMKDHEVVYTIVGGRVVFPEPEREALIVE